MKLQGVAVCCFFQAGQTLVEAVVVIGVVVLLVTGLIAGTTTSLRSAQAVRARSQAVKYAQEGIELVRSLRDTGWSAFQAYNGFYCLGSDAIPVASGTQEVCDPNIITPDVSLARSVTFTWGGQVMDIVVDVGYQDGTTTKHVTLQTYLTQWK